MVSFAHLHLHTQYSLLDGANKISEVVKRAHALGQPAIAMTDHGNLHGAVDFYEAAKKTGIKPIIGCELYVTAGSRFERKSEKNGGSAIFHLTTLAQSMVGYSNLCKLVSLAYKEGFYYKPRVDHELLAQYSEGIIVLSGCLAGEFNYSVERGDEAGARRLLEFYNKHFPGRCYLEVQPHPIKEQELLNKSCAELAREMGMPLVATTDCHYCNRDDHYAQEVLMCIATQKNVSDPTRITHDDITLFLKSGEEMRAEFTELPYVDEAIANSVDIAEMCNVEFEFDRYYMPRFSERSDQDHDELMAQDARSGLKRRLSIGVPTGYTESEYWDRLEFEIALIQKMGFPSYFLVVADFIVWAKEQGIPVGPGRGSVAGSLVAYAMRITDVDPISNKLLFERFLNPDRVSLPDIDVDFCIYGRERVIKYVIEKYGKDKVAQIVTFGTLKAKAAVKDVGRALGRGYGEMERVAQLIPAPRQGFDYSLSEALKMEPRLDEYAKGEGSEVISLALKLEGLTRHSSTHASAVVIGDRPLLELLPMMVDKDGHDVTQYSMGNVEKVGLVKFDFLGLKTLSVLHEAVRLVAESSGITVQLDELPLNDPKTYGVVSAGNTVGVFQLESTGITEMTMRLRPNSFDDLVAILALYRPGPLDAGMVDRYIERKHKREEVTYLHPLMRDVLSDTYGIILYQEQIMQLARTLAGYSLAEADMLRRAMGKKKPEEMAQQKERFLTGARASNIPDALAEEIFSQMETFARYGFNRSHSVAYALVSFQTAYMKAHYPVEFMAALMTFEMSDSDKTLKNLTECRKTGIAILPPDICASGASFRVEDGGIRYGLEAVKGVGEKAVQSVLAERDKVGEFKSFEDFIERLDLRAVNKKVIDSFVKCGAFDKFGVTRRELSEGLDANLALAQARQRDVASAQMSLFSAKGGVPPLKLRFMALSEWSSKVKLAFEKEVLGFYISGHPLERFVDDVRRLGLRSTVQVREGGPKDKVSIGGMISALKLKNTKKGDRYASFTFEDFSGTIESVMWPDTYQQYHQVLAGDEPVIIHGRADITEERATIIVEKIEEFASVRARSARLGRLELYASDPPEALMALSKLFAKYQGGCPLRVTADFLGTERWISLKQSTGEPVRVEPLEALLEESERILGRPALNFQ